MSVVIPPGLNWLVELTAGQSYPKGDPDKLRAVGDAWNSAQAQIRAVVDDVSESSSAMLEGFSGPAAGQFTSFMSSLYTHIPALGDGAGGAGDMANDVAVQIEYSQFMILLQMIWMAEQIAEWSSTIFGAAAVPVIEAAGQIAVREILITLGKQVARSVAMSVAMQEGMDAAVQAFQMFVLKDRKQWNTASTVGAIEMGAVAGALGVGLHLGEQKLMPNLVKSLPGHIGLGAFNGAVISEVSNLAFGMGGSPFLGAAAGAVGGFLGHRRGAGEGGGGSVGTIDMPLMDVKGPDFPGGKNGIGGGSGPDDGFSFDFDVDDEPPLVSSEDGIVPPAVFGGRSSVAPDFGGRGATEPDAGPAPAMELDTGRPAVSGLVDEEDPATRIGLPGFEPAPPPVADDDTLPAVQPQDNRTSPASASPAPIKISTDSTLDADSHATVGQDGGVRIGSASLGLGDVIRTPSGDRIGGPGAIDEHSVIDMNRSTAALSAVGPELPGTARPTLTAGDDVGDDAGEFLPPLETGLGFADATASPPAGSASQHTNDQFEAAALPGRGDVPSFAADEHGGALRVAGPAPEPAEVSDRTGGRPSESLTGQGSAVLPAHGGAMSGGGRSRPPMYPGSRLFDGMGDVARASNPGFGDATSRSRGPARQSVRATVEEARHALPGGSFSRRDEMRARRLATRVMTELDFPAMSGEPEGSLARRDEVMDGIHLAITHRVLLDGGSLTEGGQRLARDLQQEFSRELADPTVPPPSGRPAVRTHSRAVPMRARMPDPNALVAAHERLRPGTLASGRRLHYVNDLMEYAGEGFGFEGTDERAFASVDRKLALLGPGADAFVTVVTRPAGPDPARPAGVVETLMHAVHEGGSIRWTDDHGRPVDDVARLPGRITKVEAIVFDEQGRARQFTPARWEPVGFDALNEGFGGMRRLAVFDQPTLESHFPRDGLQRFVPHASPFGPWLKWISPQSRDVQARLDTPSNCVAASLAFARSYTHGVPTVAPEVEHGTVGQLIDKVYRYIGTDASTTSDELDDVARSLQDAPDGSLAVIVARYRSSDGDGATGSSTVHAFNAVKDDGRVVWVDAQAGRAAHDPRHLFGDVQFDSVTWQTVDDRGEPILEDSRIVPLDGAPATGAGSSYPGSPLPAPDSASQHANSSDGPRQPIERIDAAAAHTVSDPDGSADTMGIVQAPGPSLPHSGAGTLGSAARPTADPARITHVPDTPGAHVPVPREPGIRGLRAGARPVPDPAANLHAASHALPMEAAHASPGDTGDTGRGRGPGDGRIAHAVEALPPWNGEPDCVVRVEQVLRQLGVPPVTSDDATTDVQRLARRLGGAFETAGSTWLDQLRPGAVTVARIDPPGGAPHVVLVERLPDGRYVLGETQAHPGQRTAMLDAAPLGVPTKLVGSLRAVRGPGGGLAQLEPRQSADGHAYHAVESGALEGGPAVSAALLDPALGRPGTVTGRFTSRTAANPPFGFARLLRSEQWRTEAEDFEQRLGAHLHHDPAVLSTARDAVTRLRTVLHQVAPEVADEDPDARRARIDGVFVRDDAPDSAGQVGTGVDLDTLIREGNVRELTTAFYNAAFFNRGHPMTLSHLLVSVFDEGRWSDAREAGIDVAVLGDAWRQLDVRITRPILYGLTSLVGAERHFDRDVFAVGNIAADASNGSGGLVDAVLSQAGARWRTGDEQRDLGLIRTPGWYEQIGVGLGPHERAFAARASGADATDALPLPWREGLAVKDMANAWSRARTAEGLPVVAGVSGTTARMLTAARVLGGIDSDRFLGALMAWMLPGREHSLYEILRGAEMVGTPRLIHDAGTGIPGIDLYRRSTGLDLAVLRREVLPEGMMPHERIYHQRATRPGDFTETHELVPQIVQRFRDGVRDGSGANEHVDRWLARNGFDPNDPTQRQALLDNVSEPHAMALAVYTMAIHDLLNRLVGVDLFTGGVSASLTREAVRQRMGTLARYHLDDLAAGRPPRWLTRRHTNTLYTDGEPTPAARAYVDAVRTGRTADAAAAWSRLQPDIDAAVEPMFDELLWHVDMLHDALFRLPAVGSPTEPVLVYRGDWIGWGHSLTYGSRWYPHGTAYQFLSASLRPEVALDFLTRVEIKRPVMAVFRLTGRYARDIAVFSMSPENEEVLFPPMSRFRRADDPDLLSRVRGELPLDVRDSMEIILLDEA